MGYLRTCVWPWTTGFSCLLQGAVGREPFPLPGLPFPAFAEASESYYEEAEPYVEAFNGKDPEVSSAPS